MYSGDLIMAQEEVDIAATRCHILRIFKPRIEQLFAVRLQFCEEKKDDVTEDGALIRVLLTADDTDDTEKEPHDSRIAKAKSLIRAYTFKKVVSSK